MRKLILTSLALLSLNANADVVKVTATVLNQNCFKDVKCALYSQHEVSILNTTNDRHVYMIEYKICADNGKCIKDKKARIVEPHAYYYRKPVYSLYTNLSFWPNKHMVYASTEIIGVNSAIATGQREINVTGTFNLVPM